MAVLSLKFENGILDYDQRRDVLSCVPVANQGSGEEYTHTTYYHTVGLLKVELRSDGVYVNLDSLTIEQYVDGSGAWNFWGFWISPVSFNIAQSDNTPVLTGTYYEVWSSGSMAAGNNGYNYRSSGSSKGWVKIANSVNDLQHNSANTEMYLYGAGVVDIPGSATSSFSLDAFRLTITTDPPGTPIPLWEYYPWKRYNGSSWDSLNRDGSQQSKTGLFRYDSGWNKVLNIEGDSDKSKGFRHDGSGWKIGKKIG